MEDLQVETVVTLYVKSNQDGIASIQAILQFVRLFVEMERNLDLKLVMMALTMELDVLVDACQPSQDILVSEVVCLVLISVSNNVEMESSQLLNNVKITIQDLSMETDVHLFVRSNLVLLVHMCMIILTLMIDLSALEFVGMVNELDLKSVMTGTKMTTLVVNLIAQEVYQDILVLAVMLFLLQLVQKCVEIWS